ncbi:LysE family translocator [Nocardia macrotermitis]|uniref:Homoserine/homoserine lactone efflux protein n=1 Tax=Nocardia macrotermitis TaxID=2585198 RepID=A0A7K0D0Q9_9NOCA|nr:LysE family translocator [Nocardia macrotermitis]MQY19316.1 Homoserine/homoserine lactone efflux protein [Nocardia macrotermitis]
MVPVANLLAFIVAGTIIIVIPGPGVLFTVGRALTHGKRAALVSVVGHSLGVQVMLALVAGGLGTLVAASVVALTIVKICGGLYLMYIGAQAIRQRRSLRTALTASSSAQPATHRRVLRQGFIVGVTNPKAIIFFSAMLPQFVDRAHGSVPLQMLVLGWIFMLIALVSDSTWALLAGTARDWFARSPRRLEAVGGAGGVMIMGLGASVAVSGTGG